MNLAATLALYGGGPGSGCRGPNCGRPKGVATARFEKGKGAIKDLYRMLRDGEWHKLADLRQAIGSDAKLTGRLRPLHKIGVANGEWRLQYNRGLGQVRMERIAPGAVLPQPPQKQGFSDQVPSRIAPPPQAAEPAPGPQRSSNDSEQYLSSALVSKVLGRANGVNHPQIVQLADGSKAIFKRDPGPGQEQQMRANVSPGYQMAREVAAWKVARLVGMDDMVTPCIQRTFPAGSPVADEAFASGEVRGALFSWVQGKDAEHAGSEEKMYDGANDNARAAAFDYVIGDTDRHFGNWMVQPSGKLALIDHGLAFPDKGDRPGNLEIGAFHAQLINMMAHRERDAIYGYPDKPERGKGPAVTPPKDFAVQYKAAGDAIEKAMKEAGLPEGSIKGVRARIALLGMYDSWGKLAQAALDARLGLGRRGPRGAAKAGWLR